MLESVPRRRLPISAQRTSAATAGNKLQAGPVAPGSEFVDERGHLQSRVRLLTGLMFGIMGGLLLALTVIVLGWSGARGLAELARPERLAHLALVVVAGLMHAWARTGQRSAGALRFLEAGGTVLFLSAVPAAIGPVPATLSPEVMGLMGATLALVLRAALVPSTPRRTAVVGLFSLVALAVSAVRLRWQDLDTVPGPYQPFLLLRVPLFGLATVVATTVISRVIYGLQARVREAMEVGQYTLERKIGEGGMGAVYVATHRMLRRPTAIKLLPPDKAGAQTIARFEREVTRTSRLAHPNTVAIYDYGRTPDGVFYYAMEYLEGLSLEDLVRTDGPQPPGRVARITRCIAESLAEAHAAGLVHRDIKPANVMLCDRAGIADTVKVLDFGLVKETSATSTDVGLTKQDTFVGTPSYGSPEALTRPDAVDGRSDLYGLGATAYFLLTGTPPFTGETIVEVFGHHMHTPPEPPSARLDRPVPEPLEAAVLRCLAKPPEDRFPDATALADELGRIEPALGWTASDARRWWAARRGSAGR